MKNDRGYDAGSESFVSMLEAGIIDPFKVVRSALENSVSVGSSILSVGCSMVSDTSNEEAVNNNLLAT